MLDRRPALSRISADAPLSSPPVDSVTQSTTPDAPGNLPDRTGKRAAPPRNAVIVGSDPAAVIPAARALAQLHFRCVVAIPPGEDWLLRSRAIADVVHLDGSRSDAASLLRMVVESGRADLVLPTSDSAHALVAGVERVAGAANIRDMDAEVRLIVQRFGTREPSGRSAPLESAVPWSWRDPLPTVQQIANRALLMLASDAVTPTVRTALDLPPTSRWHYLRRRIGRALGFRRHADLPPAVDSILFVCQGNRMRSPAAEWILRAALGSTPLGGRIAIASAGTHARAGLPADERVRRASLEFGVRLDTHVSRPVNLEIIREADVVIAMDDINVAHLVATFPGAAAKIHLLGELAPVDRAGPPDILDPYGGSDESVTMTVRRIHAAVTQLAARLVARSTRGELPDT